MAFVKGSRIFTTSSCSPCMERYLASATRGSDSLEHNGRLRGVLCHCVCAWSSACQELGLVDASDILNVFPLGEGEQGVRGADGGGFGFLLKIPKGGVLQDGRGGGAGGCLQQIGEFFGGGRLIVFFGAEMSTKLDCTIEVVIAKILIFRPAEMWLMSKCSF